ncbi:hypothetical protein AAVH_15203 [Aphelenchoides avenae]|nr:hypothetical protein AAVH_15203 [Aphelenchus avenae]
MLENPRGHKIRAQKLQESGKLKSNPIFIPNEVLVTVFEKLPREDLERLQLVSTQFNGIIVSSSKLSEQQGPLRVMAMRIDVWLLDGRKVTCADYEDLAKRLKFATVLKMRADHGALCGADVQDLSPLLPVKSAWNNATATVEASMACFPFSAVFEFAFTQLFMCKEIIVDRGHYSRINSLRPHMRLPAIMSCNTLDISRLNLNGDLVLPADVVEWLEHEVAPENKWSEPREIILHEGGITGRIHELLTALKTAFLSSSSPKSYVVRILLSWDGDDMNDELANDKTHEVLSIRTEQNKVVLVKRA